MKLDKSKDRLSEHKSRRSNTNDTRPCPRASSKSSELLNCLVEPLLVTAPSPGQRLTGESKRIEFPRVHLQVSDRGFGSCDTDVSWQSEVHSSTKIVHGIHLHERHGTTVYKWFGVNFS